MLVRYELLGTGDMFIYDQCLYLLITDTTSSTTRAVNLTACCVEEFEAEKVVDFINNDNVSCAVGNTPVHRFRCLREGLCNDTNVALHKYKVEGKEVEADSEENAVAIFKEFYE